MRGLYFTDAADADIDDIWFSVAQDNIDAADRLVDALSHALTLILNQPMMGVARPELGNELRSFIWHKNYLLYYQRWRDGIAVIRVLHGARDVRMLEFPPP